MLRWTKGVGHKSVHTSITHLWLKIFQKVTNLHLGYVLFCGKSRILEIDPGGCHMDVEIHTHIHTFIHMFTHITYIYVYIYEM